MQQHDALESSTQEILDVGICRNEYHNDLFYGRQMLKRFPKYLCVGSLSKRNPICNVSRWRLSLNRWGYQCWSLLNKRLRLCRQILQAVPGSALFCQRCSSCDWYLAGVATMNRQVSCNKIGFANLFSSMRSFEPWICNKVPRVGARRLRCPYKFGP